MIIKEKSLALYKNRPAVVSGYDGDKILISLTDGSTVKVRPKDIETLHAGPCSLSDIESELSPAVEVNAVREAWELLTESDDPQTLDAVAELIFGKYTPASAWAVCQLLNEGLYFSGTLQALKARPRTEVLEDERKRGEKQRETGERDVFIQRLKKRSSSSGMASSEDSLSQTDHRFLQDVEALALGKTDKSRTLKELGNNETQEDAHRLLLDCGAWTVWINPYPSRFGVSSDSARIMPDKLPEEDRIDLTALPAYAIDNAWSTDPDDAVSLENSGGENVLWVHVADPASSITPDSPADLEARSRGSTLYLPEGAARMLAEDALPLFALGYDNQHDAVTPALSFKMTLNDDLTIKETAIVRSLVRITRLTYDRADNLIAEGGSNDADLLSALAALADRNVERRLDTGAVMIDFPDTHLHVTLCEDGNNSIGIEALAAYRSADTVRECMLLAGEGAAGWAMQRRLAFPYISQEAGDLPNERLEGLAGAWQLRRCMRPRSISVKPGIHWGLGLDQYTQVTSPLRRYTDLLCHQQIRAWLAQSEGKDSKPLGEEDVLLRVSAAEASAIAATKAERASRAHWLAVYLSDKKGSVWDAVVLDRKGNKGTVLIPALGIETQLTLSGSETYNDAVKVSVSSVQIHKREVSFVLYTK